MDQSCISHYPGFSFRLCRMVRILASIPLLKNRPPLSWLSTNLDTICSLIMCLSSSLFPHLHETNRYAGKSQPRWRLPEVDGNFVQWNKGLSGPAEGDGLTWDGESRAPELYDDLRCGLGVKWMNQVRTSDAIQWWQQTLIAAAMIWLRDMLESRGTIRDHWNRLVWVARGSATLHGHLHTPDGKHYLWNISLLTGTPWNFDVD